MSVTKTVNMRKTFFWFSTLKHASKICHCPQMLERERNKSLVIRTSPVGGAVGSRRSSVMWMGAIGLDFQNEEDLN